MKPKKSDFIQHLLFLNDWWEEFVDWENGGIFAHVGEARKAVSSSVKEFLPHVRQLYNYCAGHEAGHPRAERVARHLLETLDAVFPAREGELFLTSTRWDPEQLEVDAYMNAFAVLALSRFSRTFHDAGAAERALRVYKQLAEEFTDSPLAERGSWFTRSPGENDFRVKCDNGVLHRCESALNLYRALEGVSPRLFHLHGTWLRDQMDGMVRFFDQRIARPDDGFTLEALTDDALPPPDYEDAVQSLAHGFEWIGFCFEMEAHCGLRFDFLDDRGRRLLKNTLANGLAPNGCFRNDYVHRFRTGPQIASFWPQVEAPLGVLWARKRWGEPAFSLEAAERMLAFYEHHFFERPEFGGGILASVSENGVPLSRRRGWRFKCDHHAVRMCEKALDYDLLPA